MPLSFAQESLWLVEQMAPGTVAYNEPLVLRITGQLEAALLERSLQALLARHESLRTGFQGHAGRPVQAIAPAFPFTLETDDFRHLGEGEREPLVRAALATAVAQPFDLEAAPLLRVKLLRLADEAHLLLLVLHHIITDGWSVEILVDELTTLYGAFSAGESAPLAPLPIQYADYALWQRGHLQGERLERLLTYWEGCLAGAPDLLDLPADHPRPGRQTFRGGQIGFQVPPAIAQGLDALCQREQATHFMALLAAFYALLSRYTGSVDLVVGSPVANRDRPEVAGLIGFLANMLVLRADLSGAPSFRELLGRVRGVTLEAYLHQDLPFERLVEALQPERSLSHNPLFQVAFALEQAAPDTIETAGVTWRAETLPEVIAKFDLQLTIRQGRDGLSGHFVYNRDLFEAATIERMRGHWLTLLSALVEGPDEPIATAQLLTEGERQRILVEWNASERPYPREQRVPQLVEAQAARTPEALAVADEHRRLPYRILNQRANQLARHLRTLGVGPNVLVGVCLERSVDLVVALLGVLKAGGAYVPLDPAYPASRLAFMLQDAQAPVLVTRQRWASSFSLGRTHVVCLDEDASAQARQPEANLAARGDITDLAYVLYTSGSTGQPKGAQITHEGLLNLISWHRDTFAVTAADRATQIASPAFDATGWELWPYLAAGASIHLVDEGTRVDPASLRDWLLEQGITVSFLPTPLAEAILALEWPVKTPLRMLLTGGDALQHYPAAELPFALINNYGPTEATVVATSGHVLPLAHPERHPSIGRPIANTQVYILDHHLQLVPAGVPGELHIGGAGLARGYHHRPDLTAEKFIPHPYSRDPEARLYRTGDLARWRADGTIEFLGRLDHQVKIRGFRIEPGEIETMLAQHPSIRDAVVLAREDIPGEKRLVAYVVPAAGEMPAVPTLHDSLRERLPAYMLPAAYVFLDALPLSPNGKLDRQALPPPERSPAESGADGALPQTQVEGRLAAVWAEVLRMERVGLHDNFFALGGHSLLATRLVARLSDELGVQLNITWPFLYPTVAAMAAALEGMVPAATPSPETEARQDGPGAPASGMDIAAAESGGAAPDMVTLETRPLLPLLAAGLLPAVQAVALGYLTEDDLPARRLDALKQQFQGLPVLTNLLETTHGGVAVMTLPLTAQELYADQRRLVWLCRQARAMASALGARALALTGLLPSASAYGQAILDGAAPDPVQVTTGHATTTAAVVASISRMLHEAGRELSEEQVCFVGLGSIGTATLRLMLARLPHPAALSLCDLYAKKTALEALRQEVREAGFSGSLQLLEADGLSLPDAVYGATMIVGATNVGNVLDMMRVRPGALIIDDSGPHCFDPALARLRFEDQGDILFTEGGALQAPAPVREVVYAPAEWVELVGDATRLRASRHQEYLMGCVLSGVLLAREEDLAPTIGPVSVETAGLHLERLRALGFRAAPPHCGGYRLNRERIAAFRRRYGRAGAEAVGGQAGLGQAPRPPFTPC